MDLLELLKQPVGKTLEFKSQFTAPDGALRTLKAYADTAGCTRLIGVQDGTRHVHSVRPST